MKHLLLVISVLLLLGCTTPVTTETTRVAVPEDAWLADVPLAEPPNKEAFIAADQDQRILMLQASLKQQYKLIADKNVQLAGARKWKEQMLKRYPTVQSISAPTAQ